MTTLWNTIRRGAAPLGLVLAFLLSPASAHAQGDRVTVAIHCPDGVVDADWKITVEVTDAAGHSLGTVTQYVPTHTTAQAAAEGLKDQITRKFNATGTKTEENTHPDFKNKPTQAEDLVLPEGFRIGKVTTVKKPWEGGTWEPSHGHLQIYRGKTRLNNKSHGAGGKAVDAADATLGGATLSLLGSQAEKVSVQLDLVGTQDDGTPYAATFAASYPAGTTPWQILLDLGQFATDQGIVVSFPSSSSVHLELGSTLGLTLDGWWFSAFPDGTDPATGGSGGAGSVTFAATSTP